MLEIGFCFRQNPIFSNLFFSAPPTPVLASREGWADLALYAACVVILVTVPFAMFYLAPRTLFLVEDYRSPEPWLGALLAMAPLATRLVFGF